MVTNTSNGKKRCAAHHKNPKKMLNNSPYAVYAPAVYAPAVYAPAGSVTLQMCPAKYGGRRPPLSGVRKVS